MRALIAALLWLIALPALALPPGQQPVTLAPQIAPIGGVTVQQYFGFARGGYPISNGTCGSWGHRVPCAITTTRASVATVNTPDGNWWQVASGAARWTQAAGALIEESRTNSIRNNTMQGAIVGADGVEKLTNGTFTGTSGAGWISGVSGGTGTVNFSVTGQVTLTGDGTNEAYIEQQITGLTSGRGYVVTGSTTGANVNVEFGTTQGAHDLINSSMNSVGQKAGFTAPANGIVWARFGRNAGTGVTVSNLSVQDGERIQNGNFALNPINASQNTVQNGGQWSSTPAAGGTVTYSANTVILAGDGTNGANFDVSFPTVNGATYTLGLSIATNAANVLVGTSQGASTLLNNASQQGSNLQYQFTATGSTTWLRLRRTAAGNAVVSSISVQSAGALPNNWSFSSLNVNGLISTIASLFNESGVDFIRVRWQGTTTSTSSSQIAFEPNTQVAATYGQTWALSAFVRQAAGSQTGIGAIRLRQQQRAAGGGALTTLEQAFVPSGTIQRFPYSATLTDNTGVAFVQPIFVLAPNNGASVDITLDIGWPQLENNSLINSTVASATIAAAGSGGTDGTAVYSVGGGTGTAATLNVTVTGGVITAINSVASAGSYTVFPPSPAALTYVSGTGSGVTGATANLTPTNNAAAAFATSPILTTNAAVTRAADNVSLTAPGTFGVAASVYAKFIPQAPITFGTTQDLLDISDGTTNNRLLFDRAGATAFAQFLTVGGGASNTTIQITTASAQNATSKAAAAFASGDQAISQNGSAVATGTGTNVPTGLNTVGIGNRFASGLQQINGFLSEAGIWYSQRVPNAQLQSMTT